MYHLLYVYPWNLPLKLLQKSFMLIKVSSFPFCSAFVLNFYFINAWIFQQNKNQFLGPRNKNLNVDLPFWLEEFSYPLPFGYQISMFPVVSWLFCQKCPLRRSYGVNLQKINQVHYCRGLNLDTLTRFKRNNTYIRDVLKLLWKVSKAIKTKAPNSLRNMVRS